MKPLKESEQRFWDAYLKTLRPEERPLAPFVEASFAGGREEPSLLLKTVRVETHKFFEVPESIAIAEGEGDLSLAYWREVHARHYSPHLASWGVQRLEDATMITEFFEIVFRP